METNPGSEERIAKLENEVEACKRKAEKCSEELESLRQQYADDLYAERQISKALRQERQALQQDYTQLRVQKGGFGLKVLLLTGFIGTLGGLLICIVYWLVAQPKSEHAQVFDQFRDTHLFNYERSISQGRFDEVELDLERNLGRPEYQPIRPELEFSKKLVGAAKRRCQ